MLGLCSTDDIFMMLRDRNWKLRFEHPVRRVTCGYPWPELERNHRDFEKMTIKEVKGESVMEWKTKVTNKEGVVIKLPRKFHGYKLATKEEVEENEGLKEI
nr:hypothetical protein [Tanacetum cinerariifolium]